jgi:release factor glutamine methyltransferase
MTVREFVVAASKRLSAQTGLQCADPLLHAKQMAEYLFSFSTSDLYLKWDEAISDVDAARGEAFLAKRLAGEPFQYLVGFEWFWNSKFKVGPGVLIPRRETEFIVEALVSETNPAARVAELGAGTGNIGISVCLEKPEWDWHAFELNPESVPYLKQNVAALLPASSKYEIHATDFFEGAASFAPYDWIVSNPPYLSELDLQQLPREVTHEPRLALYGGDLGFELIERLIKFSKKILRPGGKFICEVGLGQSDPVALILEQSHFFAIQIRQDYSGIARLLSATNSM